MHDLIHHVIGRRGQRVIRAFDPCDFRINLAIFQRKCAKAGVCCGLTAIQKLEGIAGIEIVRVCIPQCLIDHGAGRGDNAAAGVLQVQLAVNIGIGAGVIVEVHDGGKIAQILR